jgi:hypothetical protein
LEVATVTGLWRVAALTASRLCRGFERVSRHEVASVHLMRSDLLGSLHLDAERLAGVVTTRARSLRVAGAAQLGFLGGLPAMVLGEGGVVAQEGLRQGARQITLLVARRALACLPLGLVLVAAETLAHRRQGRAAGRDHAGVARHALAMNLGHREVAVVIHANFAVGARWLGRERGQDSLGVFLVAVLAQAGVRQLQLALGLGRRMTTIAAQAGGLAGRAASDAGQVRQVRKARLRRRDVTSRQDRRQ